jgi:hypothetical protein
MLVLEALHFGIEMSERNAPRGMSMATRSSAGARNAAATHVLLGLDQQSAVARILVAGPGEVALQAVAVGYFEPAALQCGCAGSATAQRGDWPGHLRSVVGMPGLRRRSAISSLVYSSHPRIAASAAAICSSVVTGSSVGTIAAAQARFCPRSP